MVSTGLLLSVAAAVLSTGATAAFHPSTTSQRGLQDSSGLLFAMADYEAASPDAVADCSGAPFYAVMVPQADCDTTTACEYNGYGDDDRPFVMNVSTAVQCATDRGATVDQLFDGATYLRIDWFNDEGDCASWNSTVVMVMDGRCHEQLGTTLSGDSVSYSTTHHTNGSVTWSGFLSSDCSGELWRCDVFNQQQLSDNSCDNNLRAYTNAEAVIGTEGSVSGEGKGDTEGSADAEGSGNGGTRSSGFEAAQLAVAGVAILALALPFVQ